MPELAGHYTSLVPGTISAERTRIGIAPCGNLCLSGAPGEVKLPLLPSGANGVAEPPELWPRVANVLEFTHQLGVESVDFSPNGRKLATGSEDGMVRVIPLDTEELLRLAQG